MSFSRKTIVIDCGASRTALGVFSQHRGRLRLDQHVVETFPAPMGPGDAWLEQTRAAFSRLRERAGRSGPCVLVLPGHAVLTKFLQVPHVKADQRQRVIHFESEQNLPVALSELVWDSVIAAEQEHGLQVMLAACHLRKVEPLCAAARAAGFEPRLVLPAALATLAAFRAVHDQPARPSVVMNVGAYSAMFLLLEGARFVVRTFALGGSGPDAHEPSGKALSVAHGLAQELRRSLLFFRRQGNWADPEQIYLTGGGARLPGLREALAERLKMSVGDLEFPRAVEMGAEVADEFVHSPVLTDLAGAAVARIRDGHAVLNLVPPLRRRQAERRRRQAMAAAALLLVALPAAVIGSFRGMAKERRPVAVHPVRPVVTAVAPSESPAAGAAPATEPVPELVEEIEAIESPFGVELLGVKTEPYRLQLAGYLGGPGDYLAVFVNPGQPGALMAKTGGRIEEAGIELRKFEVQKKAVAHADAWPVYEVAAEATLFDENIGEEIVLDSRKPTLMRPRAMLRFLGGEIGSRMVREGDDVCDGESVFRVDRIRLDPPEVVVARQAPGLSEPEIRVLQVVDGRGAPPEGIPARAAVGGTLSAR